MATGNQDPQQIGCQAGEKCNEGRAVLVRQDGETRQWIAHCAIETWWNSPDPTFAFAQFLLIDAVVFDDPIRGIRHHGVNGAIRHSCKPMCGVTLNIGDAMGKMPVLAIAHRSDL